MNSAVSTSASGMKAAQTSLSVHAHNIANLSTPGFQPQQVTRTEHAGGGVSAQVNTPAHAPTSGQGQANAQSSVQEASPYGYDHLDGDVVGQLADKNAFLANLRVFRARDTVLGSLLDAWA